MAHVIQLALGAFISSHGVKGCTKSWEAHGRDQQLGANQSTDIGRSQRPRNEDNTGINKVAAMRPGLAKIIGKVHTSSHFQRPGTNHHLGLNACFVHYAATWWSKRVD
jgi:hypothetical protein